MFAEIQCFLVILVLPERLIKSHCFYIVQYVVYTKTLHNIAPVKAKCWTKCPE